jgi:hypothetical protein
VDLDLLDREEASLRRHWHPDTNPKPRPKRHMTSAYKDKSPRRTFNQGFLFHFEKVPFKKERSGYRAARPVCMGAKLVPVRYRFACIQPGLITHSRSRTAEIKIGGSRERGVEASEMEHSLRRKCSDNRAVNSSHIAYYRETRRRSGRWGAHCASTRVAVFAAWRNSGWSWWSRERLFGKSSEYIGS